MNPFRLVVKVAKVIVALVFLVGGIFFMLIANLGGK